MVNFARLAGLLREQRLLALAGTRLRETRQEPLPTAFTVLLDAARRQARHDCALLEAVTGDLLERLAAAGIPALPLKGPHLARAIYGGPGLRRSEDVDLLVFRHDLPAATELVRSQGWEPVARERQFDGLPVLHRRLLAPSSWLPSIELHWRVHWYATSFSSAMLARSTPVGGSARRAAPADELAALLLFFARDGFVGLRLATDIAAWWDARTAQLPPQAMDLLIAQHPEVAASVGVAATVAAALVGPPLGNMFATPPPLNRRGQRAARLANWSVRGDADQIAANVALIDGLLAPPRELGAYARRQLVLDIPADDLETGPTAGRLRRHALPLTHAPKLTARYLIALWSTRGGRAWAPLPSNPSKAVAPPP
ncbi:MAG: nucleotidyltransferase family protein [Actinomycetota bacterium]|nr:nucleotidyltransferase family protein [Actinomycetota bacterium]